ncbi:MAG: AAA family ATPase [Thermaerobacterales bacterium]
MLERNNRRQFIMVNLDGERDHRCPVLALRGNLIIVAAPQQAGRMLWPPQGSPALLRCGDASLAAPVRDRRLKPLPLLVFESSDEFMAALQNPPGDLPCRVIAVASGKGGTGKTTVSTNVAAALARNDRRVILVDADLGTANVAVSMGLSALHSLWDVIDGDIDVDDILIDGPHNLKVLPGGSGLTELANLNEWQYGRLLAALEKLERKAEYLILDTGAGIGRNVLNLLLAADDALVVTNPDPAAAIDAYALVKAMSGGERNPDISVVINRADSQAEAIEAHQRLERTVRRFLGSSPRYLGWVPVNAEIGQALRGQSLVLDRHPRSAAAQALSAIALRIQKNESSPLTDTGRPGLLQRLRGLITPSAKAG